MALELPARYKEGYPDVWVPGQTSDGFSGGCYGAGLCNAKIVIDFTHGQGPSILTRVPKASRDIHSETLYVVVGGVPSAEYVG